MFFFFFFKEAVSFFVFMYFDMISVSVGIVLENFL